MEKKSFLSKVNNYFKYFIYLSLIFLAYALYKGNYLEIPRIYSYTYLIASTLLLFLSFVLDSYAFKKLLFKSGYDVPLSDCYAGTGLSIFGKYIPGKLWMIVGKAAYISKMNILSISNLSVLAFQTTLIMSWLGLVLGAIGLFILGGIYLWGWIILGLWVVLTVAVFTNVGHNTAEMLMKKILKKEYEIPRLSFRKTIEVLPWFILVWLVRSFGFYVLLMSLTTVELPLSSGLAFPLATTLGVLSFITPGGLGVREGVMVGYLTLAGLSVKEATTISITARMWTLLGEIFIFLLGLYADKVMNKARRLKMNIS